jgi:hypothetical protein
MKAIINRSGELVLTAEGELEAYALKYWVNKNKDKLNCEKLIFDFKILTTEFEKRADNLMEL